MWDSAGIWFVGDFAHFQAALVPCARTRTDTTLNAKFSTRFIALFGRVRNARERRVVTDCLVTQEVVGHLTRTESKVAPAVRTRGRSRSVPWEA